MLELMLAGGKEDLGVYGEVSFLGDVLTASAQNWRVPDGVTSICAVLVGHGGGNGSVVNNRIAGRGGALRWINNIPVVPGEVINLYIPINNTAVNNATLSKAGSLIIQAQSGLSNIGSTVMDGVTIGGGDGGNVVLSGVCGGGGAGGYTGNGGNGTANAGLPGEGGGGGGGCYYYSQYSRKNFGTVGGGVGLYGILNGAVQSGAGSVTESVPQGGSPSLSLGRGGSGGKNGVYSNGYLMGGNYGGGGDGGPGSGYVYSGGPGAIRIMWGKRRSFPYDAKYVAPK